MSHNDYDPESAYDLVMNDLLQDKPVEITSLCDAICRGDEQAVRSMSKSLHGEKTLIPKREAINQRDIKLLQILLSEDPTLDGSLMEAACESRQREVISLLIKQGWPINEPLDHNISPLWMAVKDLDFMQWLIAKGADVASRSTFDQSTLSKAVVAGNMEVVDFLLASEQDVNSSDLLHFAAQRENKSEGAVIATKLLERGARVDAYRFANNDEALKYRWFSKRGTPLHTACFHDNIPVAEILLRYGASPLDMMVKEGEKSGPTPVEIARDNKYIELHGMLMARSLQDKLHI